jgi:hypothetical protein
LPAQPPRFDSDQQQLAFERAERLLEARRHDLVWHHELATQLAVLAEGASYGRRRAEEIAGALGLSRVGVYQHLQLLSRYPERNQVLELLRAGLHWAHVVALLPVEDEGDRGRLERMAVKHRWSVDRLRLEVQGLRLAEGGRRAPQRQADVVAAVERLDDATAAWLLAHEALEAGEADGLLGELRHALRRPEDPALAARITSLLEALERLQDLAGTLRGQLGALCRGRPND